MYKTSAGVTNTTIEVIVIRLINCLELFLPHTDRSHAAIIVVPTRTPIQCRIIRGEN
jgi:hypothetical protein